MAKLYDRGSGPRLNGHDPQVSFSIIHSFLASCRQAAVLDFGDNPIPLVAGKYLLDVRAGKLAIEAWDETRSVARRILSIDKQSAGVLECTVQRFGGVTGSLVFLDLARPQAAPRALRGARQSFGEQFRRMLRRQFPGWEVAALSTSMDLRRSFSTLFPRAHLRRRNQHIAALACPRPADEAALLSSALLWYDYLASQLPSGCQLSLCLFLPEQAGNITAHRLRWLEARTLNTVLFRFNEHGLAGAVDPQDLGNLETRLTSQYEPSVLSTDTASFLRRLASLPGIGCCPEINGAIGIRFRGLEFARFERNRILLGIESREELALSQTGKVEEFAARLLELAGDSPRQGSVLPSYPERWFESVVRRDLRQLDPDILDEPVHGQVLTFAGGDRDLIDLLAVSGAGRLTVIELKTSEDILLPVQALDYWMRIRWHAERDELKSLFPGLGVSVLPPKLLLVAPALSFHPANEIVLRYFSPEIDVQRVGVNSDWESGLHVAFRLQGADLPISHRGNR